MAPSAVATEELVRLGRFATGSRYEIPGEAETGYRPGMEFPQV